MRLFFPIFLRRLIGSVPIVLIVSMMIFAILRLLPSDPVAMLLPPNASAADAERLRALYGLDRSIPEQYLLWLREALTGNLGESIQLRQQVTGLILRSLPATIELVLFGFVIGLTLGVGMGLLLYTLRGPVARTSVDVGSIVMLSIPEFLWAIFLLLLFGVTLNVLPFIGRLEAGVYVERVTNFLLLDALLAGRVSVFFDAVVHMILPALALGLSFSPLVMRVLRASLTEQEQEDYVTVARLRGLSPARVLFNHQLRNAALPTISLIGVQTAFLFGGTLLVEVIYSYPGMGNLMLSAIGTQDLPLIQGIALTYCVVVLVINALVEASYATLNPKLRISA